MTASRLRPGRCYTRRQIHRRLGGGLRDSLPHRDGRVVCGAFTLERNPEAPYVVLVRRGTGLERWAEVLALQSKAVPIFLKRRPREWQYVGDYRVGRRSTDRATIARHTLRPFRSEVSLVLFLRRAGGRRGGPGSRRL